MWPIGVTCGLPSASVVAIAQCKLDARLASNVARICDQLASRSMRTISLTEATGGGWARQVSHWRPDRCIARSQTPLCSCHDRGSERSAADEGSSKFFPSGGHHAAEVMAGTPWPGVRERFRYDHDGYAFARRLDMTSGPHALPRASRAVHGIV